MKPCRWRSAQILLVLGFCCVTLVAPEDQHHKVHLRPSDFIAVIATSTARLSLAQASRAWRQRGQEYIRAVFATNCTEAQIEQLNRENAKFNEVGCRLRPCLHGLGLLHGASSASTLAAAEALHVAAPVC